MSRVWTRESWERSVTSQAWSCTPYDAGWEESAELGEDLRAFHELRAIHAEEMALESVPRWAEEIVERIIGPLPTCGHYAFPEPLLQLCIAIGLERCPDFVMGCYTADSKRKLLLCYYAYCLDAWLQGAPLEVASAELARRDGLGRDWHQVLLRLHDTLGQPVGSKALLANRLLHRLRWWLKTLVWQDDHRDRYLLDAYLGDVRGDEAQWGAYGNAPSGDPYFAECRVPLVVELELRIEECVPGGRDLVDRIRSTWLCAPKCFRYLERVIHQIGAVDDSSAVTECPPILRCEDTLPDVLANRAWYLSFRESVRRWLDGVDQRDDLGAVTPAKHWLVRMLLLKLELYERYGNFGKLVGSCTS